MTTMDYREAIRTAKTEDELRSLLRQAIFGNMLSKDLMIFCGVIKRQRVEILSEKYREFTEEA